MMEIWQNLQKNASQIMIFLPYYMWAENNNSDILYSLTIKKAVPDIFIQNVKDFLRQ